MAKEENTQANAETPKLFRIQKIYIKDLSFEAPGTPATFPENNMAAWKPQQKLGMDVSYQKISGNMYEAVLQITLTLISGENTVFIAEIYQAGLFEVSGFSDDKVDFILCVSGAQSLQPFARETLSSVSVKGGFPALLIPPMDFQQIYEQRKAQQSAE